MWSSVFSCLLLILSINYCSRLTQGKAIYGGYDGHTLNETGTFIENEVKDSNSTTKPLLDDNKSNEKAISTLIKGENSSSETSTAGKDVDNTTSTTKPEPNDIFGKVINSVMNIKDEIVDAGTPILDSIRNSTSNSTIPFVPDSVIEALPTWAWIVLGISLILILCCICCCPQILLGILKFPFLCVYKILFGVSKILLYPLRCCLNCIGFGKIGVRASSLAAGFQSTCYGGFIPKGSCFSCCQSCSMR